MRSNEDATQPKKKKETAVLKWYSLSGKHMVWQFFKKVKHGLPYDPEILLLVIYPKELKGGNRTNIYPPVFIVTLFTISKRWKQPRCSSTDEWIKCGIYIL